MLIKERHNKCKCSFGYEKYKRNTKLWDLRPKLCPKHFRTNNYLHITLCRVLEHLLHYINVSNRFNPFLLKYVHITVTYSCIHGNDPQETAQLNYVTIGYFKTFLRIKKSFKSIDFDLAKVNLAARF